MHNIYKISGNPQGFENLDVFNKLAQQFLPYAQEKLQFDKPVDVHLLSDPQNAKDPLGKTAYYDPNQMKITLFVDKRHVKDILRSLAHELVHHKQNCRGEFAGGVDTSPGYAQEDGKMRKLEGEAYLEGSGYLMRDWEDNLKQENKVMNEEHDCAEHEGMTHEDWEKQQAVAEACGDIPGPSKELEEGEEPGEDQTMPPPDCRPGGADENSEACRDTQYENWFKGDKDQVLFETLMKKWAK